MEAKRNSRMGSSDGWCFRTVLRPVYKRAGRHYKSAGLSARLLSHRRLHSQPSMSSIKRDVKKKVLPRPEGEKVLSRDPAHFTVRVLLDLRERLRFCVVFDS